MKKTGALLITACTCLVAISNSLTSPSFGIGEFSVIDSYIEVQENLPEIMSQTVQSTINSNQDSLTLPIKNGEELVLSTEESPTIQMQDKLGMPTVEISLDTSVEFSTGLEAGALSADGVGFGVVLQPLDDSARLITVSAEASKASSVKFDLNVSDGHFVTMNGEGAILVVQAESQSDADAGKGIAVAKIPAPWAFDGNGYSLPTSFALTKNGFLQKVSVDSATVFPVIADPMLIPIDNALPVSVASSVADLACKTWIFVGLRGSGQLDSENFGFGTQSWAVVSGFSGKIITGSIAAISLGTEDGYAATEIPLLDVDDLYKFRNLSSISNLSLASTYALKVYSYEKSADNAVYALSNLLVSVRQKCPSSRIIPVGFSQGAWVLGHSLSRIGQSWWTEGGTSQDLVAAVLLSDPGHDNPNDNGALRIYDPSGSNGGGSGIGQIIDIPSLTIDDARNWKYPNAQKIRVLSVCVDTDLVCGPNWFDLTISPFNGFSSALGIHSGWRYGSNGVAPSFAINWVNERRWN